MIDIFAKAMESLPPPDLYHTWYQPPMRLEDALGRIITIPSEYDWDVSYKSNSFFLLQNLIVKSV